MYLCIYMYAFIYIYIHVYTHIHAHKHPYTHTYNYLLANICSDSCTESGLCSYVPADFCLHTARKHTLNLSPDSDKGPSRRKFALIHKLNLSTDSFIRTYIYIHVFVDMNKFLFAYMSYIKCLYIHIYIYKYICNVQ
jgi:hypothetical protein